MPRVVFQWIDPCPNERLLEAQRRLQKSVESLGLEPLVFRSGPGMIKFFDILQFARHHCEGDAFVWCNSDVILKRNPFEVNDGHYVHGFHRREIPSGEICGGVDMYLIPVEAWDDWLASDAPDMWCGATHVDWWLSRTAQKRGIYASHTSFIDHISHPVAAASKKSGNPYFDHNVASYNAWAKRNGVPAYKPEPRRSKAHQVLRQLTWELNWRLKSLVNKTSLKCLKNTPGGYEADSKTVENRSGL